MESHIVPVPPEQGANAVPRESQPESAPPAGPAPTTRDRQARLLMLAGGAGAAFLSWILVEGTHDWFVARGAATKFMTSTYRIPDASERALVEFQNAMLAMGMTGACLGLAAGLAGGLARRSTGAAIGLGMAGLVVGGAAAAGAAALAVTATSRLQQSDPGNQTIELVSGLLIRGLPWAAAGAIAGLAFGLAQGHRAPEIGRLLVGGLLGGISGTVLYEVIAAIALPDTRTIEAVAGGWGTRLLAQCLAAIPGAAGIAALVPASDSPRRRA